jgi:hypothetical protein
MFAELKNSAAYKLDDDEVRHLGAIPQNLDSHPTATSYFRPFPIERMKRTPVDINDDYIRFRLQAQRAQWEKTSTEDIDGGEKVYSTLCHQFSTFLRVDQDGN